MPLPPDYVERAYAGVLGKIIGVYLGRPFESWDHERIMATLGEITYYVNDRRIVPNHALIMLGLLHGDDDFQKSLMIVNSSGWDTDCNSGNVGCLLGIKNGLAGMDAGPDWRAPLADRMYLSTAEGGRGVTDAVTETYHIVNSGRALAGLGPLAPKAGARFHFELPGAVQGFQVEEGHETRGATLALENVEGHSRRGRRSLALRYRHLAPGRVARAATPTFIPPEAITMPAYSLQACPTLYSGQTVRAGLGADAANDAAVLARLYLRSYGADDDLSITHGPEVLCEPGAWRELAWRLPDTGGAPIAAIGLELCAAQRADGVVYLDYLGWDGPPSVVLKRPDVGGTMWRRAWVDGVDQYDPGWTEAYRLVQNHGTGLLIQGTREWTDYAVSAAIRAHLVAAAGIGARVQGLRRYYALLLCDDGAVRLVKALDGETALALAPLAWERGRAYELRLEVQGTHLRASVDGAVVFDLDDSDRPLTDGGVALVCREGCMATDAVTIRGLLL